MGTRSATGLDERSRATWGGRQNLGGSWQTGGVPRSLTTGHWFASSQPPTLQIAVALLYWNALLGFLFGLITGGIAGLLMLLLVADIAGGYGVANERKWGYVVALVASLLPLVLLIVSGFSGGVFNVLFEIALVALLLHPMSRRYYKIWFR